MLNYFNFQGANAAGNPKRGGKGIKGRKEKEASNRAARKEILKS